MSSHSFIHSFPILDDDSIKRKVLRHQKNCQAMKWKPQQTPLMKTDLLIRNKDAKQENMSLSLPLFLVFVFDINMNMDISRDRDVDTDMDISVKSVWCGCANHPFIPHSSLLSSLLVSRQSVFFSL